MRCFKVASKLPIDYEINLHTSSDYKNGLMSFIQRYFHQRVANRQLANHCFEILLVPDLTGYCSQKT